MTCGAASLCAWDVCLCRPPTADEPADDKEEEDFLPSHAPGSVFGRSATSNASSVAPPKHAPTLSAKAALGKQIAIHKVRAGMAWDKGACMCVCALCVHMPVRS